MSKPEARVHHNNVVAVEDVTKLLEVERAARRRAEEALRMRDELVAIVSHDLRNPLSSVVTSAAVMQRLVPPSSDPRWRCCLDNIRRACDRMRRLISDLLDASDMEAGSFRVSTREIDAAALVAEVVQSLEAVAAEKGLELRGSAPAGVLVHGDRERLLQVLDNLVGNAIKYTERGQITISVIAEASSVRFSVVDTGPGIARDKHDRLFDRFWRGDTKADGVGLGLAIAQGIVTAHAGRIWVDSEVGTGTAFHFTVPRIERVVSLERAVLD